jgi:biopolymer transport protein ExbD
MKLSRKAKKKARIEIIPMIDTMFFLLVFFMVASLSMSLQRGLPVNLPHAATARDDVRQTVTLTLTKDGRLFFDRDEIGLPAEAASRLTRMLTTTQPSVVINADRVVEHGRVIDLMDAVRQSGVTRIAVAVKPPYPSGR